MDLFMDRSFLEPGSSEVVANRVCVHLLGTGIKPYGRKELDIFVERYSVIFNQLS